MWLKDWTRQKTIISHIWSSLFSDLLLKPQRLLSPIEFTFFPIGYITWKFSGLASILSIYSTYSNHEVIIIFNFFLVKVPFFMCDADDIINLIILAVHAQYNNQRKYTLTPKQYKTKRCGAHRKLHPCVWFSKTNITTNWWHI